MADREAVGQRMRIAHTDREIDETTERRCIRGAHHLTEKVGQPQHVAPPHPSAAVTDIMKSQEVECLTLMGRLTRRSRITAGNAAL